MPLNRILYILISLLSISLSSKAQAPLFKGNFVDTIKIASTFSVYQFDDKGTTIGTHEEYVIVFDKAQNKFIFDSHERTNCTITFKPDSITTRNTVFKERDGIDDLEIEELLRQCELWNAKPSLDQIGISTKDFMKCTNSRHIKRVGRRVGENWMFRRRYSIKKENKKLFRACQNIDTLNLYLSTTFDLNVFTVVTDFDDDFTITISTTREDYSFQGKFPNAYRQPWYMYVGKENTHSASILNFGINKAVLKILPKDFSREFTLKPEILIDDYIQWYLRRRGVLQFYHRNA